MAVHAIDSLSYMTQIGRIVWNCITKDLLAQLDQVYLQNIETLQLFTINIKHRVFTKVIKMPCQEAWVGIPFGPIKEGGGAKELEVICAGLPNESRECIRRLKICN